MSNTTTSASLRTLLPASLADLRVPAYSPDILSNGIISGGEERDGGGEGDGGETGYLLVCLLWLLCVFFCVFSRFTPVLFIKHKKPQVTRYVGMYQAPYLYSYICTPR